MVSYRSIAPIVLPLGLRVKSLPTTEKCPVSNLASARGFSYDKELFRGIYKLDASLLCPVVPYAISVGGICVLLITGQKIFGKYGRVLLVIHNNFIHYTI